MKAVEELRYLVLALQREGNRIFAADLRPLGVTPSQAEVLTVLARRQPLTLAGLGELLVCETGASPSRLVDRLVKQGLVARDEDDDDRRYVTLQLTRDGARLAKRIAAVEAALHATLADLAGGAPLEPALEVLRQLTDNLPAGRALALRRTD